jgi:hypothetical protein
VTLDLKLTESSAPVSIAPCPIATSTYRKLIRQSADASASTKSAGMGVRPTRKRVSVRAPRIRTVLQTNGIRHIAPAKKRV